MSASTIRAIRRKKSGLSEVKLVVLGATGVGKTALTVRFLTKRFIGEYDHQTENRYKNEMMVDGEPVIFEVLDTCPKVEGAFPKEETLHWADGFMLVYSITDRSSFNYVKELRQRLKHSIATSSSTSTHQMPYPVLIVANKSDLIHLRQVGTEEGEIFAKENEDGFAEVSASDHVTQVTEAFDALCREVHAFRRRSKQSLLDRMLGNKGGVKNDTNKK
ncbi:ras-related and estrogen-regulated growth inhibitor isoform X1 [Tachypleus tridentatus]|uniref:ras-related and estrogen-regulated growth inhibitor isoform X1 n=1 Tax=Tachypleus tridentatus TaxID=6853 RepID=UPI003FD3784F